MLSLDRSFEMDTDKMCCLQRPKRWGHRMSASGTPRQRVAFHPPLPTGTQPGIGEPSTTPEQAVLGPERHGPGGSGPRAWSANCQRAVVLPAGRHRGRTLVPNFGCLDFTRAMHCNALHATIKPSSSGGLLDIRTPPLTPHPGGPCPSAPPPHPRAAQHGGGHHLRPLDPVRGRPPHPYRVPPGGSWAMRAMLPGLEAGLQLTCGGCFMLCD